MPPVAPTLIEAVPNFSEGRRTDVIDALAAAIQAPGVCLLDRTSDPDHNRTVLTVAGPPSAVIEGLFRAVATAAQHINLFEQSGVHPRVGATDVVPLVPLRNATLAECAVWATALGRRIGEELGLPVYLYEAAATRPERRLLADVRRGQFEALINEITLPERAPDFGPAVIGPAGAVIVGARPFLVAFNIYLRDADLTTAKAIAATVRERGGGLPAVRALGLLVGGQAQVSLNLTDISATPLHVALETVRRLANDYGAQIDHTELIGLLPQAALLQAAAHYLNLPRLDARAIVENALAALDC
jgi:glutamate formiminotransferase